MDEEKPVAVHETVGTEQYSRDASVISAREFASEGHADQVVTHRRTPHGGQTRQVA